MKYPYPNTVPQTKGSTLKSMSDFDDDVLPSHSSANIGIAKRRSQQFSYDNKYSSLTLLLNGLEIVIVNNFFHQHRNILGNGLHNPKLFPWEQSNITNNNGNADKISAWLVDAKGIQVPKVKKIKI